MVGEVVIVAVGAGVIVLGVNGGGGFSLSRFGGVGVVNASAWFGGWVRVGVAVFVEVTSVVDASRVAVGTSRVAVGSSSSESLGGQQGAAHNSDVEVSSSVSLGGQQGTAHSSEVVVSSGLARVGS